MRLSESLRRGVLEAFSGCLINRFVVRRRRITLFFEDVLTEYIKECESRGYNEEMREIGELWGMLTTKALVPNIIKKLPLFTFSKVVKLVWVNVGILEDIRIEKTNSIVNVTTKGEAISRTIGKNRFSTGTYGGILGAILGHNIECIKFAQSKKSSKYVFKVTDEKVNIRGKTKGEYNRYNMVRPVNGCTLKDAIKNNIFKLSNNRLYFRGHAIGDAENTLFHIIGNRNILMDMVPVIAHKYFDRVIEKDAPAKRKLLLLKTLLQAMGWGRINILLIGKDAVSINISYPPRGLQPEGDNWNFLIKTIQGYLWTINTQYEIKNVHAGQKFLKIDFAVGGNSFKALTE